MSIEQLQRTDIIAYRNYLNASYQKKATAGSSPTRPRASPASGGEEDYFWRRFLDEFSIAQEESLSVAWYTVPGGMKNDELISF